ncbi:integrase family protein [Leptothrix cholodnii SP-6]|uniref:Integrase family protein n=1 Tax=Leptothrix cholodnii (strain ATCC 51168 / LMG 8142 / SP-6) TaxID=395495 RepID=B1Y1Y9_LEPCP|nr:tyrosine-type recombinase/integrase [Leptothrix cholodnii]ACB33169.1 integrase family protein [Leptothrix cholodnii SP-6]
MDTKTKAKHNIGTTHREVLGWVKKAAAGDEFRAAKGLYLRKTEGGAFWVYRYASPVTGKQVRAQLWADDERGVVGFPDASLEEATTRAAVLRAKVADGIDPVLTAEQARMAHAEAQALDRQRIADEQRQREQAAQAATLAQARRLTVRRLFEDWRAADLQPRVRADGKRTGRVDGGQYVLEQFTRHVFPAIGEMAAEDVRKADLLSLLDAQKSAGKMRTANVLLADLKQMLDFALERELIAGNPLATVKKSKVGGASVERDRVLSNDEIKLLVAGIACARMHQRSSTAIWLTLATGVRVGELMGAVWADALPADPKARKTRLDALQALCDAKAVTAAQKKLAKAVEDGDAKKIERVKQQLATYQAFGDPERVKVGVIDVIARNWYLPDTKNQRDHTIHLSDFALAQLETLYELREVLTTSTSGELSPWVFPATNNSQPVCVKSFGKQLSDRQREPEARMSNRTKATTSLMLPGGKWTAHDLRRSAATVMARLNFGSDTINECLNHIQSDRMARVYIQDRREADQARAFDALGKRLAVLVNDAPRSPTANPMSE